MISELRHGHALHWVTGTAAPCTSIFKPVLIDVPLPAHGPMPTDRFNPGTLWWRHERLHRTALLTDFGRFLESIRGERDELETTFHARITAVLNGGTAAELRQAVEGCWTEAMAAEERWYAGLEQTAVPAESPFVVGWTKMNRLAGLVRP
jgi:hypothetical protein